MTGRSILLLAKTGFIIRDLLLGKFSDELIKSCRLYAAVPNPNDSGLLSFCQQKSITLLPFLTREETNTNKKYLEPQHIMYRFKQVERGNSSFAINTRLLKAKYTPKQKFLVDTLLLTGKMINGLGLMGISEEIFLQVISKWTVTEQWINLLAEIKPDMVVSTMLTLPGGLFSPSVDLPVLLAAKRLGIPCGTLIQSWDNLCSKAYVLPRWLDHYWTWSQAMSTDLMRFNPRIDTKRIKVVGSPHYDYHLDETLREPREIFLRKLGLDPNRKYVVIGTGTKTMLPNEPLMVIGLSKKIHACIPDLQILLRIHPKDDKSRWINIANELSDSGVIIQNPIPWKPMDLGGFTPPQEYFHELINTIVHASVVINTTSSLTVDSSIIDRPIVSICYDVIPDDKFPKGRAYEYNFSEHFKPLVDTGGIWLALSEEDCITAIKTYIEKPDLHQQQRKKITEIIGGDNYGVAGMNLARAVVNAVNG